MHTYLHIPFCHRICPYCSFYKHTPGGTDIGAFIEAVLAEGRRRGQELAARPLQTLYLGGGTPSMLSPTHLRRLFQGLRDCFDFSSLSELTLEANPATFGKRTAETYLDLGVTRISLGAQSFNSERLATLGREHTPDDILESVRLLQQAGMPSINIDLIFSVPGQTLEEWRETLQAALSTGVGHLSAYNLTYEEDTPYFERFQDGRYRDDPDLNAAMFELADSAFTKAGYIHYETSNYAQPGEESVHNRGYWHGADYLGLGPSGVSTIEGRRWKNISDTSRYIEMIRRLGHAECETEILQPDQLRLERIALQLRTREGVPLEHLADVAPERITQLTSEGLATQDGGRLKLVGRGPLLVDSIIEHLIT